MTLTKLFDWLKAKFTKTVTVEVAEPEETKTTTIQGGIGSLVQTSTVTETPAEIADTDLTVAITIVNAVKAALASPVAVLITDLIPGTVDDTLREALVTELPVIAASLANIKNYLQSADKSAVMNDILAQIRLSPNMDMDAFLHSLAARVLTKVTKGGVTWSVAVMAVEYFLKNLFKAPAAIQAEAAQPAPEPVLPVN